MTGVFHFIAISLDPVVHYCTLSSSRSPVNSDPLGERCRTTGIAIDEAAPDCDADQAGDPCRSELGFDPTATVRRGLVGDAEPVGNFRDGATLGQGTQHLDVAQGQIVERVGRRS